MIVNQTDTELDVQFSRVWMVYTGVFAVLLGLIALALAAILSAGLLDVALGIAFIVGGTFGALKAARQRSVIRKDGNTTIERSRIIGGKTTVQEVAPADIAAVHYTATYRGSTQDPHRHTMGVSISGKALQMEHPRRRATRTRGPDNCGLSKSVINRTGL